MMILNTRWTALATAALLAAPSTTFAAEPPSVSPAVTANNAFGLDLYRALAKSDPAQNLFISPYSMSVALTMAAEGAREETEAEMARVLHFPQGLRPNERAITAVHQANLDLSQRLTDAGTTDPKARERAATLRAQLDAANAESKRLSADEKNWKSAYESQVKAQKLADELNALLPQIERYDLRSANALWVDTAYALLPAYTHTIDRYYGSGAATPLDFAHASEPSRLRINAWVADHTEQRIKDIIPPGGVTADTRLVISNAVYFKGQWASPFSDRSTKEEDFTLADGTKKNIKMMHDGWRSGVSYGAFTGSGAYFATPNTVPKDESKRPATYPGDDGFTMIELPYKGGELSMLVVAPRTADGLAALEQKLTPAGLTEWTTHLQPRLVDTAIPRFKMESEHEMTPTLQSLGMRRAFSTPGRSGGAQFSGMSGGASEDPAQNLFIGSVRHKAWVEVSEKGTEAAAATIVAMNTASEMKRVETVPFTPVFRADHPFLFLIRDTKSGVILFIGRVNTPQAG